MNRTPEKPRLPSFRSDIKWIRREGDCWVVQDPLRLQFFMLNGLEREIALRLDGEISLEGLLAQVTSKIPSDPQSSRAWLQELLAKFRQLNLLEVSSAHDYARLARARSHQSTRSGILRMLANPLAIRIPLLDPGPALPWFMGLARFLFSRVTQCLLLIATPLLALLVLNRVISGEALATTSSWTWLSRPDFWLCFLFSLGLAKSWHEFGHILACARYGVACKEAGVLLLCLVPCFYCDTTDAWKLPSRRERAMIGFAGVYFEAMIACLSAALWLASREGPMQMLLGSMLLVCSMSTLLVNLNPLLRYDGYYILSDLLGVPNLAERSQQSLKRWLVIGDDKEPAFRMVLFGLAALLYRYMMLTTILWIAWSFLVPRGLGILAIALTMSVLFGMLMQLRKGYHELQQDRKVPGAKIRWFRMGAVASLAGLLIWFAFAVPLPNYLRGRGVSRFQDRYPVFATSDAVLVSYSEAGQRIGLQSPEDELRCAELQSSVAMLDLEISQLESRQVIDESAVLQLPSKRQLKQERQERLNSLKTEMEKLTIENSDPELTFIARASREPKQQFPVRSVDHRTTGSLQPRGELLGWYVDAAGIRELVVDVRDWQVRKLSEGMACDVRWDAMPHLSFVATIRSIASEPNEPFDPSSDPMEKSNEDESQFRVVVELAPHKESLNLPEGCAGTVRFNLRPASLSEQASEIWARNFNW